MTLGLHTIHSTAEAAWLIGRLVAVVLLLFLFLRCILLVRRPGTSMLCVLSLAAVSASTLTFIVLDALVEWDLTTVRDVSPVAYMVLAIALVAIVLAVIGLMEYSGGDRSHSRGKPHAILAVVLGCFTLVFCSQRWMQDPGGTLNQYFANQRQQTPGGVSKNGVVRTFPDQNCRFTIPDKPWVELKASLLSEDATLGLMRTRPQTYFTLIAENGGGLDMDSDEYAELVKGNIRSAADVATMGETVSAPIGDLEFRKFEANATVSNVPGKVFYDCRALSRNGYYYQLITWGQASDSSRIRKEADAVARQFSIIDPDRIASTSGSALEDIRSESLGFETHLATKGWSGWETLHKDQLGPAFGATYGDFGFFVIDALPLGDLDPDDDVLLEAMLHRQDIPWPDDSVSVLPAKLTEGDESEAWDVRTKQEFEGIEYLQKLRIVRLHGTAYALSAWAAASLTDVDQVLDDAINSVTLFKPTTGDTPSKDERIGRANILNRLGLAESSRERPAEALKFYKAAYAADPSDPVILGNTCYSHFRAKEFAAGVDYLKSHIADHPDDLRIQFYHALLTGAAGDLEGSIPLFEKALSGGYNDEDDLLSCLNLFVDAERPAESIPLIEIAMAKNPTATLKRWHATMHTRAKQFDTAIELLKNLATEFPDDVQILYEWGETCNQADQFTEAEAVAKLLVDKGFDNARTALIKGWSEYNRSWYQQARETFRIASSKNPSDADLKEALQTASSALGKADNSNISTPIEPVAMPPAVADIVDGLNRQHSAENREIPATEDLGAYFSSVIRGTEFRKGKTQKSTTWAKVKILDRSAITRFSTLQFPFDPPAEQFFVNEIKVVDADGKTLATSNLDDYYVSDDTSVEADHNKILNAPVPGLREGVELHYSFTRESASTPDEPEFQRDVFARTLPQDFYCLFFTGDTGSIRHHASPEIALTTGDGTLAWTLENIPAYQSESMQPDISEFVPMVITGSDEKSWNELGMGYLERIADRLDIDEDTKQLAEKLLEGKTGKEEKIAALARFVRSELEYKAIEFGVRSQVPNQVKRILSDKYGDCKDHSLLLTQLLNSSGIPAHLALANTAWSIRPEFPSLDQFDHMVVHVPGEGNGIFIDCTDKYVPSEKPLPPLSLGGASALILDPKGGPSLVPVSDYPHGIERLESDRVVSVSGKDAAVTETVTFHGYTASSMRSYLAGIEPRKRAESIHRSVAAELDLQLNDLNIVALEDPDSPLQIEIEYTVKNVFEISEKRIKATLPSIWERYYLIPDHADQRKNPFEIQQDFTVVSDTLLLLDRPADPDKIKALTGSGTGKFCRWNLDAKPDRASGSIRILGEVTTAPGSFPPDDYATYESERRAAVKALGVKIDF